MASEEWNWFYRQKTSHKWSNILWRVLQWSNVLNFLSQWSNILSSSRNGQIFLCHTVNWSNILRGTIKEGLAGDVPTGVFPMQIHTCSMRRRKPFELEQNPSASATLKPVIEHLGQEYFLYFFPMIAQGKFMSCAPDKSSEEDGPLRAFTASLDEPIILDDAVEDVNLACVNGRSCKGTALLPFHMFRMGLFMCEKRYSNKDPDEEKDDQDKSSCRLTDKTASLHPECFERCMCLACAVHSLVSPASCIVCLRIQGQ